MALFRAKFAYILVISNPIFRWGSCKDSVRESVKNCSSVCKEAGTCYWISRAAHGCKPLEWCTRAKYARNWSVTPAVALQNKSPRLAKPFAHGLNLRLNPVVRSSCQNTLFGKIWLFTFLLTLLYIYPYSHDLESSKENFKRETLEKTRLTHPQSLPKRLFKFFYSLPLHCQILESLITKTFSHHIHFCKRAVWCFGKQLERNQFHIGWCYGQVAESKKLEKK